VTTRPGRVSIVGAGPGDPELLTVRAAQRIAEADDLVVDALVPPAVYCDSRARVVYVGKRAGRPHVSQEEINAILVELARAGRTIVRLKGGDPGLFGRAAEEIDALDEAGVPWELVPGVSSALAAPSAAGVPVTERGVAEQLLVATGHRHRDHPQPVPVLPPFVEDRTVVLLMGLGTLPELVAGALANGYPADLPAAVVSQASWATQRVVACPLAVLAERVAEAGLEAPATVVLGRVARRAERFAAARNATDRIAAPQR
jgi:uroporphyrin-III C-methyltransferase